RCVAIDSGYFMILPAQLLDVPEPHALVFSQAFMSVGLGLAGAAGAAVARPDVPTIAVVGDGGLMMSLGGLDDAVRHALPILVIVLNDGAYGAEVEHLTRLGMPIDHALFGSPDLAAIARACGATGLSVRSCYDLDAIKGWLDDPSGPLLLDCKIDPLLRGYWPEEV